MNESVAKERARIWKGLGISALLAVVLLFTVVLPAEYGYDPTHVGRVLGLTKMSGKVPASEATLDTVIEEVASNEDLIAAAGASPKDPLPLPNPAVSQLEATAPKTETLTIKLGFDERTEVKAVLAKNKAIVYDWEVEGGDVYVDFHGHDPAKGDHYWVRYEEAGQEEGIKSRHGSLVAPFTGEHGWYWLNLSQGPITIKLTVTGYFDKLVDYGLLR